MFSIPTRFRRVFLATVIISIILLVWTLRQTPVENNDIASRYFLYFRNAQAHNLFHIFKYFFFLSTELDLLGHLLPPSNFRRFTIHRPRSVTYPIMTRGNLGRSNGNRLTSLSAMPRRQEPRRRETRPRSCSSRNPHTPERSRPSLKHWCITESSTSQAYQARTCLT